jgi:hypothetical protein
MRRISFNQRFINKAGNNLVPGKIHTIRGNYDFWKRFEGQEVSLFHWEGKPYRSKQKVFCVKKIVGVQMLFLSRVKARLLGPDNGILCFSIDGKWIQLNSQLAENDGFTSTEAFNNWFAGYKSGKMAIIHFTDFEY